MTGFLEILAILECGSRTGNRQAIERVGVEAVLDPFQGFDQIRMADGKADPQTGQRTRLGQGLADQQVRVLIHQRDSALAAEVDIGLIHQHHRVRIGR